MVAARKVTMAMLTTTTANTIMLELSASAKSSAALQRTRSLKTRILPQEVAILAKISLGLVTIVLNDLRAV